MSKIFSADIRVWATAYVKADTAEQALEQIQKLRGNTVQIAGCDEIPVSGLHFDDPALPELSLSPVASICSENIDSISADELEEM